LPVRARLVEASPLFFVATTAALVWPIYPALGNRIEPRVFGLPWSLCYVLGLIVLNTLVLAAVFAAQAGDDEEEHGD
jgi:predicted PurR-regulated permease PerM